MPDAHDFPLVGQCVLDVGVNLVQRTNLFKHLDHAFVGAAVQGALERADGRGDRGIHVAQRGDGHSSAEGGGVETVIGVQHIAHVDGVSLLLRRLLAIHQIEKIRGLGKRGI